MSQNIVSVVALEYLRSFPQTNSISKYSPTAAAIAIQCRLAFKTPDGGVYSVTAQDVLAAAEQLELATTKSTMQIGISAEAFNARRGCSVSSITDVCVHGFAPYTFEINAITKQPARIRVCPRCPGGFVAPSAESVAHATEWLNSGRRNGTAPNAGSLILAARELGLSISKPINAILQIKRP